MPRVSTERFWTEPYRVLFPVAALVGAAGAGAWAGTLSGTGPPMGTVQHGLVMLLGTIGSGIVGFLGTAYPRQNGGPLPGRSWVLGVAGLQVAVVALLVAGWWQPVAQGLGLGLASGLWGLLAVWAARIALPSLRRRFDPTTAFVPVGATVGAVAWALCLVDPHLGLRLALYGAFVPIALVLLDRMLPFFSRKLLGYDGLRKGGFLPFLVGLLLLRGLGEQSPVVWEHIDALASLGLGLLVLRQAHGWRPAKGFRVPLVAVLHLGWMCFAAGYLVDAAGAVGLVSAAAGLHFHTLGLVVLLLGFGIRVLRGHAGLELKLGTDGKALVGVVLVALLLRAVLPLLGVVDPRVTWLLPALLLSVAFAAWGLRWGPLARRASS